MSHENAEVVRLLFSNHRGLHSFAGMEHSHSAGLVHSGSCMRWTASCVESRPMQDQETCPLPEDPTLAAIASALNDAGQWAEIFDPVWGGLFLTDEARRMYGGRAGLAPDPLDVDEARAAAERLAQERG